MMHDEQQDDAHRAASSRAGDLPATSTRPIASPARSAVSAKPTIGHDVDPGQRDLGRGVRWPMSSAMSRYVAYAMATHVARPRTVDHQLDDAERPRRQHEVDRPGSRCAGRTPSGSRTGRTCTRPARAGRPRPSRATRPGEVALGDLDEDEDEDDDDEERPDGLLDEAEAVEDRPRQAGPAGSSSAFASRPSAASLGCEVLFRSADRAVAQIGVGSPCCAMQSARAPSVQAQTIASRCRDAQRPLRSVRRQLRRPRAPPTWTTPRPSGWPPARAPARR